MGLCFSKHDIPSQAAISASSGERAQASLGAAAESVQKVDKDLYDAAREGNTDHEIHEEGVRDVLARGANPNGYKDVR